MQWCFACVYVCVRVSWSSRQLWAASWCWRLNLRHLEKQPELLTSNLFLQPWKSSLFITFMQTRLWACCAHNFRDCPSYSSIGKGGLEENNLTLMTLSKLATSDRITVNIGLWALNLYTSLLAYDMTWVDSWAKLEKKNQPRQLYSIFQNDGCESCLEWVRNMQNKYRAGQGRQCCV